MKFQIQDGEIYATINQKDGMVSFEDNPEKYNSATMMSQLDIEVRVAMFYHRPAGLMRRVWGQHNLI